MRIKTDGTWMVDATDDGVEIRPYGRSGAKVVVGRDGSVQISSSSRLVMSMEDWNRLKTEVEDAKAYMESHPLSPEKEKALPRSQITGMSYYRDSKGRGVFEVGKAKIDGWRTNRSGCPYVRGVCENFGDVQRIDARYRNGEVFVEIFTKGEIDPIDFDSRAREASGLVEKLWSLSFPVLAGTPVTVTVDGNEVLECLATETYAPGEEVDKLPVKGEYTWEGNVSIEEDRE